MCPEMNVVIVEPAKTDKKVLLVIGTALLTLILGISGVLIYRFSVLQRIPELKRVDELDVNYYDVSVSCYDGEKYKYVSPNSRTKEESLALLDAVHKFASVKGRKVNDWTPDKITYPVYSVTISPVIFKSEEYVPGETVVWSNGYLFTASGDVYKCNPDFRSFTETDDNDFVREGEVFPWLRLLLRIWVKKTGVMMIMLCLFPWLWSWTENGITFIMILALMMISGPCRDMTRSLRAALKFRFRSVWDSMERFLPEII